MRKREPSGVKVKVIDFSSYLEELTEKLKKKDPNKKFKLKVGHDWGFVETPKGIFALCEEGVGPEKPLSKKDPMIATVYIEEELKSGSRTFAPAYEIHICDEKAKDAKVSKEVDLEEFIRVFGDRLESNYRIWKRLLSQAEE